MCGPQKAKQTKTEKKNTNEKSGIFLFGLFRDAPAAYGGSQGRGQIRAAAPGLHHCHNNTRSEPHLQPTPQLMATLDPQPTEQGQGSTHNLMVPSWIH